MKPPWSQARGQSPHGDRLEDKAPMESGYHQGVRLEKKDPMEKNVAIQSPLNILCFVRNLGEGCVGTGWLGKGWLAVWKRG